MPAKLHLSNGPTFFLKERFEKVRLVYQEALATNKPLSIRNETGEKRHVVNPTSRLHSEDGCRLSGGPSRRRTARGETKALVFGKRRSSSSTRSVSSRTLMRVRTEPPASQRGLDHGRRAPRDTELRAVCSTRWMIKFGFPVDVARPVEDVFAYLTDPANLPEWQGTSEVTQLTEGPVSNGTRFREVHERRGFRVESVTEVTEYERNRRFHVDVVSGPIPLHGRWKLEPTAAGTRIHFRAEGRAPRNLRFAEPLLARVLQYRFRAQHRRLKRALEDG